MGQRSFSLGTWRGCRPWCWLGLVVALGGEAHGETPVVVGRRLPDPIGGQLQRAYEASRWAEAQRLAEALFRRDWRPERKSGPTDQRLESRSGPADGSTEALYFMAGIAYGQRQFVAAADLARRYLLAPDSPARARQARRWAELPGPLAEVTVTDQGLLTVDERLVGQAPTRLVLAPGEHRLLLEAGGAPLLRTLTVAAGASPPVTLTPPAPVLAPAPVVPPPRRPVWRVAVGSIGAGLGALGVGFGASLLSVDGVCMPMGELRCVLTDDRTGERQFNTRALGASLLATSLLFTAAGVTLIAWPAARRLEREVQGGFGVSLLDNGDITPQPTSIVEGGL